jgi:hypothetical protein
MHIIPQSTWGRVTGVFFALASVVGGVLFVDDRYVHANDFKISQSALANEILKSQNQIKTQICKKEVADIEDQILRINLTPVGQRTDIDKALLERYKRRLDATGSCGENN